MSLTAKATYMATKANLIMTKLQPLIDKYNEICQMGVELLAEVGAEIQAVMAEIDALTQEAVTYITASQSKLMAKLNRRLEKLTTRLNKFIAKVTELKNKAIEDIEEMITWAVSGISGVTLDVSITPPDPILGTGGSISIIPTPDLIDESTLLVDQTLTDPTTVVHTVTTVVGTSASGGPVTGTGTSIAGAITTT
jgi:ribosome-associated translation inhibitor RaiA